MSRPAISQWTIVVETHQEELSIPAPRFWSVARCKRGPGLSDIETPIVTGDTYLASMTNAIRAFADIIEDKKS